MRRGRARRSRELRERKRARGGGGKRTSWAPTRCRVSATICEKRRRAGATFAPHAATRRQRYAESACRRPQTDSDRSAPANEQTIGEVWKDGDGLDANDWSKTEQKKLQDCRVDVASAHAADQLCVESDDSAPIDRFPTSVSMDVTGSSTVKSSPRAALSPRRWPLDGHERYNEGTTGAVLIGMLCR